MVKSTVDPRGYSIPVKDSEGNDTGIYLHLDNVLGNGEAQILEFFNVTEGTQETDSGNTITEFDYDQRKIPWNIPRYYTKNGTVIEIGHFEVDETGKQIRVVTDTEVIDYITENALEISGFAIQTKIKFTK